MTIAPTHFTLEGLFLWSILKKEDKEDFIHNHPFTFLLLNFTANMPDLDSWIGIHRTISHSLLVSLFVTITLFIAYKRIQNKAHENLNYKKYATYLRWALYGCTLWIFHIFLDLTAPLILFWPLSNQFYQIDLVIAIDVAPNALLPYGIAGIFFKISTFTYSQGFQSYIVNIPPAQREQVFGAKILYFSLSDPLIHLTLAFLWGAIVGTKIIPAIMNRNVYTHLTEELNSKLQSFFQYVKTIRYDTLALSGLLIFSGFALGPHIGATQTTTQYNENTLIISSTIIAPIVTQSFEPIQLLLDNSKHHGTLEVTLNFTQNTNLSFQLIYATKSVTSTYVSQIYNIFKKNLTDLQTWQQTLNEYHTVLTNFQEEAFAVVNINSTPFQQTFNVQTTTSFSLSFLINNWTLPTDANFNFSTYNEHTEYTFKTIFRQNRQITFLFGWTLILLGSVTAIISLMYPYIIERRKFTVK